ncbi:MAG: hypothetical protein HUU01_08565, partial [Saprospiraceae bacterium]|nr:hypothetical protein [Saprospiraceae bacterium]
MKKSAFFPALAACLFFYTQTHGQNHYSAIDSLLKDKQFFAARDLLRAKKEKLSTFHQLKLGAEIDNAFNQ